MTIDSKEGKGTSVNITIPLKDKDLLHRNTAKYLDTLALTE